MAAGNVILPERDIDIDKDEKGSFWKTGKNDETCVLDMR
jgi:hypothetical protein